jgi:hypothetical protein
VLPHVFFNPVKALEMNRHGTNNPYQSADFWLSVFLKAKSLPIPEVMLA